MKKLILSMVLAAGISPLPAQTSADTEEVVEYSDNKYKVETNTFWHNWFISVGAGGQVYFGDHDRQCDFGDRLAPALDIAVGKWFTPGIGVRLMYSGLQQRGATKHPGDKYEDSAHGTGDPVQGGGAPHWLEKQKFNMGNIHADVLFNFSNLFCGYNPKRVWNCSPYAGLGWAMVWESPSAKEVSANVGILNSFRLCDALDLNLDVRGMFVNDRFDGEGGGQFGEGMLSATVGLTYKFKQRGWNRSKTVVRYNNAALNEMREKLNEMSAENERLKRTLAEGNKREAQTIVKKMAAANLVTFKISKSKLSNEARANLGMLAEVIKQGDKNVVYTITGYADAGTGSKATNERLSKARAQAVYDCLVKEFGVSQSQLRIDYKGGVDNMFYDDPRLSRAVITRGE
jgi:major outer membrane protein ompA